MLQHQQGKQFPSSQSYREFVSEFVAALKQCSRTRNLERGKELHRHAIVRDVHNVKYVATSLITMYSKCGRMELAREMFDRMPCQDAVAWNSLIMGYVENGDSLQAMELFDSMSLKRDAFTYAAALKACGELASSLHHQRKQRFYLKRGKIIHEEARSHGYESDIVLNATAIDMYRRCGSMSDAYGVFVRLTHKDIVVWTSLIVGYVDNGKSHVALDLFYKMNCQPDTMCYIAAIRAFASLISQSHVNKGFALENIVLIQTSLQARTSVLSTNLAATLVRAYSKCGMMNLSRQVFGCMSDRNVVSWTSLIMGYVNNRNFNIALDLFSFMDCEPDPHAYVASLKGLQGLVGSGVDKKFCMEKLIEIHKQIKAREFQTDIVLATTLIELYSNCGYMLYAREFFDSMSIRNVIVWNTIILGYIENGNHLVALDLFSNMEFEGTSVTYVAALKAYGALANQGVIGKQTCLEKGMEVHDKVKHFELDSDMLVATTLLDMYCKCGNMSDARKVFDSMVSKDAVTWTSLLLGYVENGECETALTLFDNMHCPPDCLAYVAVIKACGGLASGDEAMKGFCLEKGIAFHEDIKVHGFQSDLLVTSALVDMYGKCGSIQLAKEAFDKASNHSPAMWNSMIFGLVENGQSKQALELFDTMECHHDSFTYVAVLKACEDLSAQAAGQQVHAEVCRYGLELETTVANTLMDFYVSCGCITMVEEVFGRMPSPDTVSWNTLIAGYSSVGDIVHVFESALKMQGLGRLVDDVTLTCLLAACSNSGLIGKCKAYLEVMRSQGVSLSVEHYNCVVDTLGRAGRLQEALCIVNEMPVKVNTVTWTTLLAACETWKNVEVGKVAFDALVSIDRNSTVAYVMMSSIYRSLNIRSPQPDQTFV